jgi:hypothetical protein
MRIIDPGVAVYSLFLLYPVVRTLPYHAEFYVAVSSCATVGWLVSWCG